jgi:putative MATE family efflux protein
MGVSTPSIGPALRPNFLEGPITPQLLRLALPVLAVLALGTIVGVAETWFVSFLGTDALTGVALVFPVFMLMLMMSNGGIGGGVASAVARAIGAGRKRDVDALVTHAAVLAVLFGASFTIAVWLWGPALFARMGGKGEALHSAVLYANLVFLSAIPGWMASLLSAALRAAGNVRVPALIAALGSLLTLMISPLLVLGWGPVPRLGVAGAGIALIGMNVGSALAVAAYLRSSRSPVRLGRAKLERRLFADILKVGLPSAVGTIVSNLTVVITTALVGAYGRDAIAGYGLAARLDYLLIPLLFAIGTASVTMIGTNVGAGQFQRARRIAWTAALASAVATGAIGLAAALFPQAWMGLFTNEAPVLEHGEAYLLRIAPLYAVYGAGMAIYFASQGAGRVAWPFAAGIFRLLIVFALGGYWVDAYPGDLDGLYWVVALSYLVFGLTNMFAMAFWPGAKLPGRLTYWFPSSKRAATARSIATDG